MEADGTPLPPAPLAGMRGSWGGFWACEGKGVTGTARSSSESVSEQLNSKEKIDKGQDKQRE